ncbi:MAG: cobalt-precorrin-5B (C(1))-methyltransferase CbiD [Desulfobacterales bacterium]
MKAAKNYQHRKLRSGFTTGTAAAAAAKGALISLLEKRSPEAVAVKLLNDEIWRIPLRGIQIISRVEAECTVVKDAGDDPDVTNGAVIGARVTLLDQGDDSRVEIAGGKGVGKVTKPGLEIPPGEPAINPGPRKMIKESVISVLKRNRRNFAVRVEIFVPDGERLAQKTMNFRLGIKGGISILGTTGVVRPMSHEAYTATIFSSFSVARALGVEKVVLSTGRRSERCAQKIFSDIAPEGFVQIGDFFSQSIRMAREFGFKKVFLAVFFGKAIKMAQGAECTHAAKTQLSLQSLAAWAIETGCDESFAQKLANANTGREAFGYIRTDFPRLLNVVGERLIESASFFSNRRLHIGAVIFDYNEKSVWHGQKGMNKS